MHCQSLPAGLRLCSPGRPGPVRRAGLWQQQERGLLPPIPTERPRLKLGLSSRPEDRLGFALLLGARRRLAALALLLGLLAARLVGLVDVLSRLDVVLALLDADALGLGLAGEPLAPVPC